MVNQQQYQYFLVWDLLLIGWILGQEEPVLQQRSIFVVLVELLGVFCGVVFGQLVGK